MAVVGVVTGSKWNSKPWIIVFEDFLLLLLVSFFDRLLFFVTPITKKLNKNLIPIIFFVEKTPSKILDFGG